VPRNAWQTAQQMSAFSADCPHFAVSNEHAGSFRLSALPSDSIDWTCCGQVLSLRYRSTSSNVETTSTSLVFPGKSYLYLAYTSASASTPLFQAQSFGNQLLFMSRQVVPPHASLCASAHTLAPCIEFRGSTHPRFVRNCSPASRQCPRQRWVRPQQQLRKLQPV